MITARTTDRSTSRFVRRGATATLAALLLAGGLVGTPGVPGTTPHTGPAEALAADLLAAPAPSLTDVVSFEVAPESAGQPCTILVGSGPLDAVPVAGTILQPGVNAVAIPKSGAPYCAAVSEYEGPIWEGRPADDGDVGTVF